jgi:hypothetical protein
MHTPDPNVGTTGAPAPPPSPPPTTSRPPDPTAVEAFRRAQSANDRLTHLSGQLGTVTQLVQNLVTSQNATNDETFFDRLGAQLSNGEIDQAAYTRRVAERTAQRVAAQAILPPAQPASAAPAPPPMVDPNAEARRAQQYGARAIVQGLGLQGNEPGLDFSSPQALMHSGQRVLAQRQVQFAAQEPPEQSLNVNDAMGELARQQGYVIPHRDGGRPAGVHPQPTEADLDKIVWDRRNKNAPLRTKAALQNVRDSLAGRTPTVRTGEGLLGNPSTFRQS